MIVGPVFYLFALALIFSASLTVSLRQPVSAVLCLIWSFFNAAGLLLTLGADFLAFILLIVYIGAVAVLFLFVVMMLDVRGQALGSRFKKAKPAGLALAALLAGQLGFVAWFWPAAEPAPASAGSIQALGRVLYTTYFYPFQICGLILLVAMAGAIALTLRHRPGVKKQKAWRQITRKRDEVVEIRKVSPGEGAS